MGSRVTQATPLHFPDKSLAGVARLLDDLHRLMDDRDSADIVFLVGREEVPIYAHCLILRARLVSPYLQLILPDLRGNGRLSTTTMTMFELQLECIVFLTIPRSAQRQESFHQVELLQFKQRSSPLVIASR